jgi:hypothetical protein
MFLDAPIPGQNLGQFFLLPKLQGNIWLKKKRCREKHTREFLGKIWGNFFGHS